MAERLKKMDPAERLIREARERLNRSADDESKERPN